MDNPKKSMQFTIDEKLILVNDNSSDKAEIIRKLGGMLFNNGFVKDTYTQAVLDRELTYPTGLQARVTGVAVPHTDTTHVLLPAVAVATLNKPIVFNAMGAPDNKIDVYIVIMLAVHDPKEVITVLRKIIGIVQNDDAINKMLAAKTPIEIKKIFNEQIGAL